MRTAVLPHPLPALVLLASFTASAPAQEVALSEPFKPGHTTKIDVQVKVSGKLALPPTGKEKEAKLVTVSGTSKVSYEERVLPPEDAELLKTVRAYREVQFERTVGAVKQDAGIRPSVRRLVSGEMKADSR